MENIKKLFAPKDLTEGTPWKRIVEFAIPMLIGNIAQQFYSTADSIIVGKYVGDNALAAVGSSFPILMLLLVLFVGVSTGAGIMVSQYFGAKDREKLSRTIGVSITLTAIASLIIMVIGPIVTRPLLSLLNTPDAIIDWSANYLVIYFVGIAGFSYYNMLSGIMRGLGDSLSALGFLLISTALNVVLDIWFVAGLGMGVAGVALATVIAQAISAALCTVKLLRMKDVFDLNWKVLKLDKHYSHRLIKLGLPSGLTQGIFSLAMVAVQSLTNSFGPMVIACSVIVMRVDGFAMMPNFTFGMAMTTYAGQNIGAKRIDRVEKGTKDGTWIAVGYVAMAVTQCLSGVMRGAGDTMTPMWISLISTVALRVPVAYGIAYFTRSQAYPTGRPEATFISLLVSWTIGAIITAVFFKKGAWRNKGFAGVNRSVKRDGVELSQ